MLQKTQNIVQSIKRNPQIALKLRQWYLQNRRSLPWRSNRDPYRIWLSEVMLQQTTVAAVIPYYERFLKKFPTLRTLAKAPLEEVLELWSGLGYYSRARNLHKAAQVLNKNGFPKTYQELLEIPGFGPYTSRAVSSLAFDEPAGVLDGNVIRILTRRFGLEWTWWQNSDRLQLQNIADTLAQQTLSSDLNQAMMELGATVCTPQKPLCAFCPWRPECIAFKKDMVLSLPLSKPKKDKQIWLWEPFIITQKKQLALVSNQYSPFLKGQWLFPGNARQLKKAPKIFDFKHSITHHQIFVNLKHFNTTALKPWKNHDIYWVKPDEIIKLNPASLLQKTLQASDKERTWKSS